MMAIGSMIVLLSILLLVPGLASIGKWDADPHVPKSDLAVRLALRKLLDIVLSHRTTGVIALAAITCISLFGGFRMLVETDFTKNFYASNPIVQGYQVVESELGGAGVWDIIVPAPKSLTEEYLDDVRRLEQQLRQLTVLDASGNRLGLTKVLSIADADEAAKVEPLIAALPVTARLEGMRQAMPEFSQALLAFTPDENNLRWLRIMLRSREQTAAAVKSDLISQVQRCVKDFTGTSEWSRHFSESSLPAATKDTSYQGEVTGYHVMLSRLVSNVLEDQWLCFAYATLGIF